MNKRYLTAALLIAIIFPILYFGGFPLYCLMAFMGCAAGYEISRLTSSKWPLWLKAAVYVLMLLFVFWSYIPGLPYAALTGTALLLLATSLVWVDTVTFEQIGLWYLFYNIIGLMCGGVHVLYDIKPHLGIFFMIFGTIVPDSSAYFIGRRFGRTKLNERVSPNKTIEGFVGACICGLIVNLVWGYFFMHEVFESSWLFIIIASLLMPLAGQMGDLIFSAIKRRYQIKDFSNLFPGHGGALDRLDSISFNSILIYILAVILL